MQIKTDVNVDVDEFTDDHPVASVLTDEEKALYLSLAQELAEVNEVIEEITENNDGEFNLDAFEETEASNKLSDAVLLDKLFEEAAAWRKAAAHGSVDLDKEESTGADL